MATKNTYDCGKCPGYCCSYDYIETKASDVTRLAKHHGLAVAVAREKFTRTVEHEGKTIRVLRHRKDHVYKSMCMFFDQDERRSRSMKVVHRFAAIIQMVQPAGTTTSSSLSGNTKGMRVLFPQPNWLVEGFRGFAWRITLL